MSAGADKFKQALERHAGGQVAEAVRLYQEVVRANPRHAHAWHQLACIASQQGRPETAMEYFVRAIRLDGGQAVFHNNLGECCRTLGKLTEAAASLKQAIRLRSDYLAPRMNLSLTLYAQGRPDEAEQCALEALRLPRNTPSEHCVCATFLLLQSDFERGLPELEWRLRLLGVARPTLPGTRWDGRPLDGQSILLVAEQGLGDTLQFVRYVAKVIEHGGKPVLAVPQSLLPLLSEATLCEVVPWGTPTPQCTFHASLMSLPCLCGTTLSTIPNQVPYLRANARRVSDWQQRLADVGGVRIGIGWQGNPVYTADRTRSVPLAEFSALAEVPGANLISLQKGPGVDQLDEVSGQFAVRTLGTDFDSTGGAFMDSAAVMQSLDLVVTSDSAIAHLAGALGVSVWVALPIVPDWRWLLDRDDSPWYPTMRLFRQTRAGDWASVFRRIVQEVQKLPSRP